MSTLNRQCLTSPNHAAVRVESNGTGGRADSEGESDERAWSCMRDLIGGTRTSLRKSIAPLWVADSRIFYGELPERLSGIRG